MPLIFGGRWAVPQKPRVFNTLQVPLIGPECFFRYQCPNYHRKTIGKWWFYGGLMVF